MHKDSLAILHQLVAMSHELGRPEYDLAILGEGNTSALLADGTFLVKASGCTLRDIDEQGFVTMDRTATERLLDSTLQNDAEIAAAMQNVCVGNSPRRPSVEAMMHAYLLGLPEIRFVGHTHPTPVNALLCSTRAEELSQYCLFPDQIVCCGPVAGVRALYRSRLAAGAHGAQPRAGLDTGERHDPARAAHPESRRCSRWAKPPMKCSVVSLMWAKTARVMLGALACGGINPLTTDTNRSHFHATG